MKIKNILVSQPEPQHEKSPYHALAKKYKLNIDFRPFIQVERVSLKEFRQQKISLLDFSAVIFTSRTAVDNYFSIAKDLRLNIPTTMRYFCMSESIAYYLQNYIVYRKRRIFYGNGKIEDLLPAMKKFEKDKYVLPVSDKHKQDISRFLKKNKFNFKKVVMYKTIASDLSDIDLSKYDSLLFFSPAGVHSLMKNFPNFKQSETFIGAFGPATAKAIKNAGLRLDIKAPLINAPSMTMALEDFIKKQAKEKKTKV